MEVSQGQASASVCFLLREREKTEFNKARLLESIVG